MLAPLLTAGLPGYPELPGEIVLRGQLHSMLIPDAVEVPVW